MNNPELFVKSNSASKKYGQELLEEIKNSINWTQGERVLDVGCGPGDFTANVLLTYLPSDASLVGCDISREMIGYANTNARNPRVSFEVLDIECKNIANDWERGSFTKIYSNYCFHWLEDWRQSLENMHLLLKSGGEIFLLFLCEDPIFDISRKIKKLEKWKQFLKEITYSPRFTRGSNDQRAHLLEALNAVGFRNVEISIRKRQHTYPSIENYQDLILSVLPYGRYIPVKLKTDYESYVRDLTKQTINHNNGEAKIQYSMYYVRGMK